MTETDAVMISHWSAWSRADDASIGCHSVAPNKINPGRASPISNIRRIPTRRKVRCGWKGKISYQIRAERFSKESHCSGDGQYRSCCGRSRSSLQNLWGVVVCCEGFLVCRPSVRCKRLVMQAGCSRVVVKSPSEGI